MKYSLVPVLIEGAELPVRRLGPSSGASPWSAGVNCTVCNVSHYWSREQKDEQQNNGAAGYLGPVKIELRELRPSGSAQRVTSSSTARQGPDWMKKCNESKENKSRQKNSPMTC